MGTDPNDPAQQDHGQRRDRPDDELDTPFINLSGLRLARVLDDLYHQANANVARITGTTTTSERWRSRSTKRSASVAFQLW